MWRRGSLHVHNPLRHPLGPPELCEVGHAVLSWVLQGCDVFSPGAPFLPCLPLGRSEVLGHCLPGQGAGRVPVVLLCCAGPLGEQEKGC